MLIILSNHRWAIFHGKCTDWFPAAINRQYWAQTHRIAQPCAAHNLHTLIRASSGARREGVPETTSIPKSSFTPSQILHWRHKIIFHQTILEVVVLVPTQILHWPPFSTSRGKFVSRDKDRTGQHRWMQDWSQWRSKLLAGENPSLENLTCEWENILRATHGVAGGQHTTNFLRQKRLELWSQQYASGALQLCRELNNATAMQQKLISHTALNENKPKMPLTLQVFSELLHKAVVSLYQSASGR